MGCNWLVCLAVWMAMAAEDIAGKILAIVSKPSFDPNVMTGRLTKAEEDSMLADPYKRAAG